MLGSKFTRQKLRQILPRNGKYNDCCQIDANRVKIATGGGSPFEYCSLKPFGGAISKFFLFYNIRIIYPFIVVQLPSQRHILQYIWQ